VTVGDLKKFIFKLPDDMIVVVSEKDVYNNSEDVKAEFQETLPNGEPYTFNGKPCIRITS